MKKGMWFLVFFLVQIPVFTQELFDFESGKLSGWKESTPGCWQADSIGSISEKFSLHHIFDNPEAGSDAISHSLPSFVPDLGTMVFMCRLRHRYAPSSGNYWVWFLYSDADAEQMVPGGKANGYALGVNATGSDDFLRLWKVKSGSFVSLYNTGLNWEQQIGTGRAPLLKVTRDSTGFWSVAVDTTGTGNYEMPLGGIADTEFVQALHTGFRYVYSATKDRLLWVDNIRLEGRIIQDTLPPVAISAEMITSQTLYVGFSEPLNRTIQLTATYEYAGERISASACPSQSGLEITFRFSLPFPDGDTVFITVDGGQDVHGNCMAPASFPVYYHHFKRHEVLISEIMADPFPPVGLPGYEYAELYNASPFPVNLNGWKLEAGSSGAVIKENVSLRPGEYLILTYKNSGQEFGQNVKAIPVFSSETFLANIGSLLILKNPEGEWVDAVPYTDKWYQNSYKADGGWSLEIIDPSNPCAGIINWKVSESPDGGTPGRQNSVFSDNPDRENPVPLFAVAVDSQTVDLTFSEPVDSLNATGALHYNASKGLGIPEFVCQTSPESGRVRMHFAKKVETEVIYELRVDRSITDCAGNVTKYERSVRFAVPSAPQSLDIVINEIMYHPDGSSLEFIELYNNSQHVIDLSGLFLAIYNAVSGEIQTRMPVSEVSRLIFPDDYLVLCKDCEKLNSRYRLPFSWSCVEVAGFPALSDQGGRAALLTKGFEVIDAAQWSDDMQFALLHTPVGVSLERIHPSAFSDAASSWHSAASTEGCATPGRRNSQSLEEKANGGGITVTPEVFSPDNDGMNDVLEIRFTDDHPGWVTDIQIFEANGRLVRKLISGKLTGTFSGIVWDGTNDNGHLCYNGIYIILIRRFDLQGHQEEYKKTCVLYVR